MSTNNRLNDVHHDAHITDEPHDQVIWDAQFTRTDSLKNLQLDHFHFYEC